MGRKMDTANLKMSGGRKYQYTPAQPVEKYRSDIGRHQVHNTRSRAKAEKLQSENRMLTNRVSGWQFSKIIIGIISVAVAVYAALFFAFVPDADIYKFLPDLILISDYCKSAARFFHNHFESFLGDSSAPETASNQTGTE